MQDKQVWTRRYTVL